MSWINNCKETSVLVTRSLDARLNLRDRMAMRLHLLICKNCARFARQMHLLRGWLRNEDTGTDAQLSDAARERIAQRLHKED